MVDRPRKVTLLAAAPSNNCMGRVWILADMLARYAQVRILGVLPVQASVWPPLAGDTTHPIVMLPRGPNRVVGWWRLMRYLRRDDADLYYVCKPRLMIMLAALAAGKRHASILDIDDWEEGMARDYAYTGSLKGRLIAAGISGARLAEWLVPLFPRRTLSNPFLEQRFGGTVIPHARDGSVFGDDGHDRAQRRRQFGLPETAGPGGDVSVVMFLGTPRRHKGVMALIRAVAAARTPNLYLVVAGDVRDVSEIGESQALAQELLPGRHRFIATVPWRERYALLHCADMLVVPQMQTRFTRWGQTPAKLFDAMAVGRPLIVSDIADTRQIVGDTAWLVPPGDVAPLAAAIDAICSDPETVQRKVSQAHARFEAHFSYDRVAPVLARLAEVD